MTWKDLPSADWAEMMDLWHCHKPDKHENGHEDENGKGNDDHQKRWVEKVPHSNDENGVVKGCGEVNQVTALPGTVLVDVSSFVVADGDCKRVKKVVR